MVAASLAAHIIDGEFEGLLLLSLAPLIVAFASTLATSYPNAILASVLAFTGVLEPALNSYLPLGFEPLRLTAYTLIVSAVSAPGLIAVVLAAMLALRAYRSLKEERYWWAAAAIAAEPPAAFAIIVAVLNLGLLGWPGG